MSEKLWAPNFMESVRRVRSWLWKFEDGHTFAPGALTSDPILGEDIRQAIFWDLGGTGEADALMVARKNDADTMEFSEVLMGSSEGITDFLRAITPLYQSGPIVAPMGTEGSYTSDAPGNTFHLASYVESAGTRATVAVFGEGVAEGDEAKVWGGNFVAYANHATSANVIGVEINYGKLIPSSGGAYGLVIAASGAVGSNGASAHIQMQANRDDAVPEHGIIFHSRENIGGAKVVTGALIIADGSPTCDFGIDFSEAVFAGSAVLLPNTPKIKARRTDTGTHLHRIIDFDSSNTLLLNSSALTSLDGYASGVVVVVGVAKKLEIRRADGATRLEYSEASDEFMVDAAGFKVYDSAFTLRDNLDPTKQARFQASTITAGQTRTLSLPDEDTALVGTTTTQTLTNKTLTLPTMTVKDNALTLQDDGDVTKQARFQASGITAGQTRTLTIPDASGTLALAMARTVALGFNLTWTNMPSAATELMGAANAWRFSIDTTFCTQVRLTCGIQSVAGASGSKLYLEYSTTFGGAYAAIGTSAVEVTIDTTGTKDSGWISLAAGAIASEVWVKVMGSGGDGAADPLIRTLYMEVR